MTQVLNKIKGETHEHTILILLLIIYILFDVTLPMFMVQIIDTDFGKAFLYLMSIYMFINVSKVVGVLAFIAAYTMIDRAGKQTGTFAIRNYLPSEEKKVLDFSKFNEYPYTLEEEEVARMAPIVMNETATGSSYKPVLDALHDAAPTEYEGVI
jgi:hypothetical protein